MAIGVAHIGIAQDVHAPAAVDGARRNEHIFNLPPIGATVHPQRAADGARNAAHERQAGEAGFLCLASDLDIRHRGAGAKPGVLDSNAVKAASQSHHRAWHPTVAHDQVGAETDGGDGELGRQMG